MKARLHAISTINVRSVGNLTGLPLVQNIASVIVCTFWNDRFKFFNGRVV